MKKMLFVMNPCAGKKRANVRLAEILTVFDRAGYEVEIYITKSRGDATTAVAQKAAEKDVVVCCGGDGTFNETLEGILTAGVDVPMGYIPAGSTNDFAKSLHIPTDVVEAAKNIVRGKPYRYDAGLFGDRHFSYVASFGAFTKASYATPQKIKNILGHTAYLLGGVRELKNIHRIRAKFVCDDQVFKGEYLFAAVCNSTSVAGLISLDPKRVDMSDGLFEVMLVRKPKSVEEVREMIRAVRTKDFNCSAITFVSASKVKVTTCKPVDWTLDGELQEGVKSVEITNQHRVIKLLQCRGKR